MRTIYKDFDINKLLEYGFKPNNNSYEYSEDFLNNKFKAVFEYKDNLISKVIDNNTLEEYLLVDVESASGNYVGKVRKQYEELINNVISKCSNNEIFKFNQTIEVINYIKSKYQDGLEFLWEKFPNYCAIRNKKNNKWYAAIMTITEDKLNLDSTKEVEIIDLLYYKDKILDLIDNKSIFPGWHMNKKSWITVKLDNTIKIEKIYKLIDISYEISINKGSN